MMRPTTKAAQSLAFVPFPHADYYLLALRWLAFVGMSAITLGFDLNPVMGETAVESPISLPAAILIIAAYNIPISLLVWRLRPLATGRIGWLLLADVVAATLITALTGGGGSLFYFLFAIAVIEAGLAYCWRVAIALVATISLASLLTTFLTPNWSLLAMVTVVKFFSVLMMGLLITLFSEQMRQEYTARQAALLAAERMAVLNEISLRLGESQLEPERILATLLDSTHILPDIAFSLVALSHPVERYWYVAASTTERHPVGQRIPEMVEAKITSHLEPARPGQARPQPAFFLAGVGTTRPLPEFVAGDGITQFIGTPLILPSGVMTGVIAIGRQTERPLSHDEQLFLRSLALEAGLALRNAQLYAREQEQVTRLRRFETLQATFFSATAHELKTPLTVLKTLTPTLRPLPHLPLQTQNEISETFTQNLERLELLVADMLESARLEAGTVALRPRALDLAGRTRRVLERLAPLLARKQQKVELQAPANLPPVQADGKRVEQILSNLIDNAAKFAPPASVIEVSLSRPSPPDGRGLVQVAVADAGPGVPPQDRELIFDKFYSVADKALAGVGLGLFICRELIRLHGGRIWVEERPGGGSRFCFTLPLAAEEIPDEESQSQNSDH